MESTDDVSPLEVVWEQLYRVWRPRQVVGSNNWVEEDRTGTAVAVVDRTGTVAGGVVGVVVVVVGGYVVGVVGFVVVVVAVHNKTEVDRDRDSLHCAVDTHEVVGDNSRLADVARKLVVAADHTVDSRRHWALSVKVGEAEEDCWKRMVLLLVWKIDYSSSLPQLVARWLRDPSHLLRRHSNTLVDSARRIPIHHPYPTDPPHLMSDRCVAVVVAAAFAITVVAAVVVVVLAAVVVVVAGFSSVDILGVDGDLHKNIEQMILVAFAMTVFVAFYTCDDPCSSTRDLVDLALLLPPVLWMIQHVRRLPRHWNLPIPIHYSPNLQWNLWRYFPPYLYLYLDMYSDSYW
jgi:hypothetical protein